ncbi:hypothetical protein LZG04_34860 [Saccharothrix sp. S26]|uniref:hypothetical protein n=1 Tax=Saccharothrix sp. S26 TaxID=2907215 RepID=UPI001F4072EA|nr:hypothetical protein [Saccharothrix sp. S26]MCE6999959.1 hypothetical protein [Saccharothrix sp. S26]
MTERPAPAVDAPWYQLLLVGVVVVTSGILATVGIGRAHAALHVSAVPLYALPVVMHLTAVYSTWLNVRAADLRRRNALRRSVLALAVILMVLGALTTPLYLGNWNPLVILVSGVVAGGGPLVLALVLFPVPEKAAD